MDKHTLFVILHLVGVVVGMGAAVMSDVIFLRGIKKGKINPVDMKYLVLASKVVWSGVALIIISGALLFSQAPDFYLGSSKFLVKMTIVATVIINGLVFHYLHIPRLVRGEEATASTFMSGAVSSTSWISALVLGAIPPLPYSYFQIISVYLVVLAGVIGTALLLRKRIL